MPRPRESHFFVKRLAPGLETDHNLLVSRQINLVRKLRAPFLSVAENIFVVTGNLPRPFLNRYLRLILPLQGRCALEVDDRRFTIEGGDLVILPPGITQHYEPESENAMIKMHVFLLMIDPDKVFGKSRVEPESMESLIRRFMQRFIHLPGGQTSAMRTLLADIRQEVDQKRVGHVLRLDCQLRSLVVEVTRSLASKQKGDPRRTRSRGFVVEEAQEFINKNYPNRFRLGDLAWHLRMSEEHLARLFKKETGRTVFEFLAFRRMEVAKGELLGTTRSVTEIASRVGFSSPALFCRNFKAMTGMTPTEYRCSHSAEMRPSSR